MSVQQKCTYAGWLHSTPFKKKKMKASVADRDQYVPDGLSPTGSVSSVCISGRRRCDAASDGEDGTLFPRNAKCE